jgi:hypothetical protein
VRKYIQSCRDFPTAFFIAHAMHIACLCEGITIFALYSWGAVQKIALAEKIPTGKLSILAKPDT